MKLSATLLGWAVAAIVDGTMAAPNPAAGASAAEPAVQPADDYSPVVRTCSTKTQLCYNQYTSVEGGVAYGIAIPQTTSGNFDVALKMVAQRRVQWAAISWGGDMVNAPLTIGWVNGRDVVVTTRYTT